MARALLVGCGCAARQAGELLVERGWAVRGTTRERGRLTAIEGAGIEAVEADPDRVGSIVELLGDVTVLAWLLGSLDHQGAAERLHRQRLPSLLHKLVDTPVRGLVYEPLEPAGDAELRAAGLRAVEQAGQRWRIPTAVIEGERARPRAWAAEVADRVAGTIGGLDP